MPLIYECGTSKRQHLFGSTGCPSLRYFLWIPNRTLSFTLALLIQAQSDLTKSSKFCPKPLPHSHKKGETMANSTIDEPDVTDEDRLRPYEQSNDSAGDENVDPTQRNRPRSKKRGYHPVTMSTEEELANENTSPLPTLSLDDAVETMGYGFFQIRILIATGLCFAADAMQVVSLTFVTPILEHEWKLTADEGASLESSLFAGAMVGTLCLGPLADRIGRRPVFA